MACTWERIWSLWKIVCSKHLKQNINIPLVVVVAVTTEGVLVEWVEVEEDGCGTLSEQSGTLCG